jgi:sugar phosphate isomerase/epimerase
MSEELKSRREILKLLGAAPFIASRKSAGEAPAQGSASPEKPQLALVSRHIQWTSMEEGAAVAAEAGFHAIAWTVRPGAHMEPEHVERDLPKAVDIARKAGLATPMLITAIVDPQSPRAEAILESMRSVGIRRYRAPSFRYDYNRDLDQQWEALKPRIASLVKLNEKYGTTAMYHTHSGPGNVGGGVWDLWLLVKDFDPRYVGLNFDVGHATARGGAEWIETSHFAHKHVHALSLKDFRWVKKSELAPSDPTPSRYASSPTWPWVTQFVPPGEGMVNFRDIFAYFRSVGFSGPLETYFEYFVNVPGRPPVDMLGTDFGKWKLEMPKSQFVSLLQKDVKFYNALLAETKLGNA